MRWWLPLGFASALVLGIVPVVGCSEGEPGEPPECVRDEDCEDLDACTIGVCDAFGRCYSSPWMSEGACVRHDGVVGFCEAARCTIECQTDEQCNDGLECTDDFCYDFFPEDAYCEVSDTCYGLEDDGNWCTAYQCNRYSGKCEHLPIPDGYRGCGSSSCGPCPWTCLFEPCQPSVCCSYSGSCQRGVCVEDEDLPQDCTGLEDGMKCRVWDTQGFCWSEACHVSDCDNVEDGTPCEGTVGTGTCKAGRCELTE